MTTNDIPVFARTSSSHPLGKLTFQVKTDLPEEAGEALVALARDLNMSTAELTRELLCWRLLPDRMQSVMEQRAKVMQGNGPAFVPQ